MTNIKTLMLAAAAALSLGAGTAVAQDSAFFTEQAQQWPHAATSQVRGQAVPMTMQPQAGSSDVEHARTPAPQQAPLYGAAGTGG